MADELLKRFGTFWESAARLARKAAEAERAIGIHGVSVSAALCDMDHSAALRSAIEAVFRVHDTPTRGDLLHRTVELPKPVTVQVAETFNRLFGRRE